MWQVTRPRRFRSVLAAMAVVSAVVFGLTGCASESGPTTLADKGLPYTDLLTPKITASVADGDTGVRVNRPLTVSVEDGVLDEVTVEGQNGEEIDGTLSADGRNWESTAQLGFGERYTINARAEGLAGVSDRELAFRTYSPDNLTMPYLVPGDGSTVGIGQPVAIRFDERIPDRKAAEKAITVTTEPPVEGAFYWLSNQEVRWRPEHYWAPGTTVTVKVDTYGVDLGGGMVGQDDTAATFTIGDAVIATADDNTKTLTVRRNGEVIKTMPISMGKDNTPTDNGTYIVGDRHSKLVMDSSTYGVPTNSADGYRTEVSYATQMSYSGIYVHAAPWSVGAQGYSNASHGCLNVSTDNALWFYQNTKRGDIVDVVNTVGSTLPGTDGLGDWNIDWKTWKAGNAG